VALVISEAPHALDLTGGRVLGRGETANVDLSNPHEAEYYNEGWLTILDGSSPPPPPTPPESIQVAGSPFETGQVIYYNGSVWTVLDPGDAGEVLMTHGVNAFPEWVPIDVSMFAFDPATQSELDVHASDTTNVHGIADTADLLLRTIVDAKGDLFVATADNTVVRLAVGANGQILQADSAQSSGVKWATLDLSSYAPLASPAFTGSVGLPTYTLATRPSASIGAGKTIYVTDADPGSKLQVSDGAVWRNYNPAQVTVTNTQTANYTLALSDAGGAVEMNGAGALTVNVPPNSSVAFPVGTVINIARIGAGAVTIAQGAGVVLRNRIEAAGTTNRTIANQWSEVSLRKRATDEWVLVGDIA
jgi:hypothetical protein